MHNVCAARFDVMENLEKFLVFEVDKTRSLGNRYIDIDLIAFFLPLQRTGIFASIYIYIMNVIVIIKIIAF